MKRCLVPVLLFVLSAGTAQAGEVISALQAHERVATGALTLIDVRWGQEWKETGLPRGGRPITIHDPGGIKGFVAKVVAAVDGNRATPVALICARGIRSTRAEAALEQAGFTRVYNVREGMDGNWIDGPGWLDRQLPVVAYGKN